MLPESEFGTHPFCMRRGAELQVDQGPRLSERSEFELDPGWTEHRRLPVAQRRDADSRVAFSFAYFAFGEAKKGKSPAAATERHRTHRRNPVADSKRLTLM